MKRKLLGGCFLALMVIGLTGCGLFGSDAPVKSNLNEVYYNSVSYGRSATDSTLVTLPEGYTLTGANFVYDTILNKLFVVAAKGVEFGIFVDNGTTLTLLQSGFSSCTYLTEGLGVFAVTKVSGAVTTYGAYNANLSKFAINATLDSEITYNGPLAITEDNVYNLASENCDVIASSGVGSTMVDSRLLDEDSFAPDSYYQTENYNCILSSNANYYLIYLYNKDFTFAREIQVSKTWSEPVILNDGNILCQKLIEVGLASQDFDYIDDGVNYKLVTKLINANDGSESKIDLKYNVISSVGIYGNPNIEVGQKVKDGYLMLVNELKDYTYEPSRIILFAKDFGIYHEYDFTGGIIRKASEDVFFDSHYIYNANNEIKGYTRTGLLDSLGYSKFTVGGKEGILDINGVVVVPAAYDAISNDYNGYVIGLKDGIYSSINYQNGGSGTSIGADEGVTVYSYYVIRVDGTSTKLYNYEGKTLNEFTSVITSNLYTGRGITYISVTSASGVAYYRIG